MKRPGQCVLRNHGDEDFHADMPSYADAILSSGLT